MMHPRSHLRRFAKRRLGRLSSTWLATLAIVLQTLIPLGQGLPTAAGMDMPAFICKVMQAGTDSGTKDAPGTDPTECPVCMTSAFAAPLTPSAATAALPVEFLAAPLPIAKTLAAFTGQAFSPAAPRAPPHPA